MERDISSLNRVNVYNIGTNDLGLEVYWVMANNSENSGKLEYKYHKHTFYQLHFIVEGSMKYGFIGRDVSIKKGHFFLIPPNLLHKVINHSDDFLKITIAFSLKEESPFNFHKVALNSVYETTIDMEDNIEFIFRQSKSRSTISNRIIKQRLNEIIYLLVENISRHMFPQNKIEHYDDRCLKAKKHVEDNPNIFFTCEEIADYCSVSVKQLNRLFIKYEKLSLFDYIHSQKVALAKELLLSREKTQKEIAKELGFASDSYFNKFFTRHEKMTPKQFVDSHNDGTKE